MKDLWIFALFPIILSIGILPTVPISFSEEIECPTGEVETVRINTSKTVCIDQTTAQRWSDLGIAEISDESNQEPVNAPEESIPLDEKTSGNENETTSMSIMNYTQIPPIIDPEKGYFVAEISDGLYWLSDGVYQIMFLTTGEGVIVVDAPPSIGSNILTAIDEVTDEPITHVIYSHIHQDHIGAAYNYPENATIISHVDTANHLEMKNDPNRPIPTETFVDDFTLVVGDQTLELSYKGAFHSKGDIMIFAPKQNVLMVVDHFHPAGAPFKGFAITTDMNNYIAAHDIILEFDPELIISGHTEILATPDHVQTNKEFTMDVLENAVTSFQTVDFNEVAIEYGELGSVAVFDAYLDTLAKTCVDLTIEQWDGKLHDLGVFMEDNCSAMVFHVFID